MDTTDRDHSGYIIDSDSVICFGDAHLATAVGADGDVVYLMYELEHECPERGCCQVVTPRHERTGKLPADVRRQVNQCRAFSRTRHAQCRNPAPLGEQYCHQHKDRAVAADG
jgi:hypothetical protein